MGFVYELPKLFSDIFDIKLARVKFFNLFFFFPGIQLVEEMETES